MLDDGFARRVTHALRRRGHQRINARRDPRNTMHTVNSRGAKPSGTRLRRVTRRYYSFHSNTPLSTWASNAYVNVTRDTINYINKGGIPLVIGEWSLSGAHLQEKHRSPCRSHRTWSGRQLCDVRWLPQDFMRSLLSPSQVRHTRTTTTRTIRGWGRTRRPTSAPTTTPRSTRTATRAPPPAAPTAGSCGTSGTIQVNAVLCLHPGSHAHSNVPRSVTATKPKQSHTQRAAGCEINNSTTLDVQADDTQPAANG